MRDKADVLEVVECASLKNGLVKVADTGMFLAGPMACKT